MPERADEARETSDDTREALLAEAAALWAAQDGEVGPPGDPGRATGDLPGFLSAYYRLVATDDLVTAGPRRVAAVAAWNAALVESRPQGRAVVQVRDVRSGLPHRRRNGRGHRHRRHALPSRHGDDRAQQAPGRHRPDRPPAAHRAPGRGRQGARNGARQPRGGAAARRRGRVLDSRGARPDRPAGDPGRGPAPGPRRPAGGDGGPAAHAVGRARAGRDPHRRGRTRRGGGRRAAGLAVGRPLHVPRLPRVRAPPARRGAGTAPGARYRPRHPPPRRRRLVRRHAARRRARRADRPAARAGQVEHQVHRLPAQLHGLRGGPQVRPGRPGHGRVPVPRPVHAGRLHRVDHPDPGAAAQA